VRIGKLILKNPVMVASGTFGEEYKDLVDINSLGAIIMKTITLKPRTGNPPPRLVETPSGMLNSIGLENKGVDDFIKNKLPALKRFKIPVIASISGDDEDEFTELARRLEKTKKIDALELNFSCPNIRGKGMIAQDAKAMEKMMKAARSATDLMLIAKLSPNVTDIVEIAKIAEASGADSISLINTFPAMAIDIEKKAPVLGNMTGGLSGPAIKPIALKIVYDLYRAIEIPIIGIGGIMTAEDAIEFILAGAKAIQVGTANFVNPKASVKIIEGIRKYLAKNKISDINELVGKANKS
jgi:dihydroorotate dehydrogenase (NAD+) catalytic subunit